MMQLIQKSILFVVPEVGEKLKVNMNDYMSVKFLEAFRAAKRICEEMEKRLKLPMEEIEIGYLAMHIERIMDREEGE